MRNAILSFILLAQYVWGNIRPGLCLNIGAVTTQQLSFLSDISKLAQIAYCDSLAFPFQCSSLCPDFSNTTLIQVCSTLFSD
jgi:hypothetical protein